MSTKQIDAGPQSAMGPGEPPSCGAQILAARLSYFSKG